ncbi:MAG: T9SS type A sorting domain-containing protein [Bacteroidota bacterium]|nr:T9SS type A sorting domain-containing protein [Bacteroidota bacterium]
MKKLILLITIMLAISIPLMAGIWNPEGLNMPGGWNGWTNPPTNALALASATQVAGGKVTLITTGTPRYHTKIKVATSGGDVIGGTYSWLFTSGPSGSPWNNKWGSVTVSMNTLQTYIIEGSDNSITVTDGKWYTVNWQDNDYANTQAIFMETSGEPVTITEVTDNYLLPNNPVTVSITISAAKSTEERIFVRYTIDGWASSSFVEASGSGTSYSAVIPASGVVGTHNNQYNVFTTTVTSPTHTDADMVTINYNNNSGFNYILPIQLASFVGYFVNSNDVTFEWETISEIHNYGFWIQKRNPITNVYTTIEESFQPAKGEPATYTWTYKNAVIDNTEFYLLQQDLNGLTTRFGPIMLNPNSVGGEAVPSVFALNQNYPNPFNPSTVIKYQLAADNYTTLKVYNMIGKEVATLVNGNQTAGYHQVTFDAAQLSNGIYFYKLQSGNNVEVKKLTLVK